MDAIDHQQRFSNEDVFKNNIYIYTPIIRPNGQKEIPWNRNTFSFRRECFS